jgi:hypothetical protein
LKQSLSTPNEMDRRSAFAATSVGKSFCPHPPVLNRRKSLDAVVDNVRMLSVKQNPDVFLDAANRPT